MKLIKISALALTLILLFGTAHAGTMDVLTALEEVKGSIESGISPNDFDRLEAKTNVAINIAKRDKSIKAEFIKKAQETLVSYMLGFEYIKLAHEWLGMGDNEKYNETISLSNENLKAANDYLDELYELAQ